MGVDLMPDLLQLLVRVHAEHADEETDAAESRAGELRLVGEGLGFLKGHLGRVGHQREVVRGVKIPPDAEAAQRVLLRAAGRAGAVVPQLLPGLAEHEFDEGRGDLGIRRAAQQADGIDADAGAAERGHEADARAAIRLARLLLRAAAVKVDAHARRGLAPQHIERDFRRGIGEVARVRGDALDERQPGGPALVEDEIAVLFDVRGVLERGLHLLLHQHFEDLCHAAAFRRIGERDLAKVTRIGQIGPRVRLLLDAEAFQHVLVVNDAAAGDARAAPAALRIAKRLAADGFRDHGVAEPLRMLFHQREDAGLLAVPGHQSARFGLRLEIVGSAAKKHVHADSDLGGQKGLPSLRIAFIAQKGLRDVWRPFLPERVLPVILKSGRELAFEQGGDLRGAAGHAPVDVERLAGLRLPLRGKGVAEFIADEVRVRRDDHDAAVKPARRGAVRRFQQKRAHQHGQHRGDHRGLLAARGQPGGGFFHQRMFQQRFHGVARGLLADDDHVRHGGHHADLLAGGQAHAVRVEFAHLDQRAVRHLDLILRGRA